MMERNFLKSSLQNASLNIILQVLFRCNTFLLNAYVVHRVSQEAVGIMYVRLLLLESTILFLSREAFRKACLSKTVDHQWTQVINLVWLTVPLCAIFSFFFGYIWLNILAQPDVTMMHHYRIGVWAVVISCVINMCSEPLYLIMKAFLFIKFGVIVDLISVMIRSVTFAVMVWNNPENAVLAFSVAQILCCLSYCLIFYGFFAYFIQKLNNYQEEPKKDDVVSEIYSNFPLRTFRDMFPKKTQNQELIDWKLCNVVWSFLKQGVMMQLLTEGERYVMTLMNVLSFSEQGVFDVVSNLGSLAARFIFRPIEESAYFYFSQMIHRDKSIVKQNKKSMEEAASVLENLLRGVLSIGMLVLCFGQSYSKLLLQLYGGSKLADGLGPKLLRMHCFSIFLLAINGITESYTLSTMDTSDLNKYNKVMVVMSIGYLIANWLLSYIFGSVGFILANCCNMITRIIHSILFIRRRYRNTKYSPLNGLIPNKLYSISLFASLIITCSSEFYFYETSSALHFLIGCLAGFITLLCWLYEEWNLVQYGLKFWKEKVQ